MPEDTRRVLTYRIGTQDDVTLLATMNHDLIRDEVVIRLDLLAEPADTAS